MSIALATIMLVSLCAVCASTSVSAAASSNANAQSALVGSPIAAGTGPAACVLQGSTSMYVFVKGTDGALWYRIYSIEVYSWVGGWFSLGGLLSSSPCAVSRYSNNINVYVRGTNGAVYENQYNYGTWSGFYSLGGQVAPGTGPGTSGWPGREDIFVEGTNGALYQKTWTSSPGWSGWVKLGGQLTSSPAAATFTGSVREDIEVFVRGTNGAVYQKAYYDGAWHDWYKVGGQVAPGTGPAVCSYDTERMDLFVEGTNGALYQLSSTSEWSSWVKLGGGLSASPTAATHTFNGGIDIMVFVRGSNGLIYHKMYWNGAWHDWQGPYQGPSSRSPVTP